MYAITGSTGNTGKLIVETLLSRGQRVIAIGRRTEKLEPFVKLGAEAYIGELNDTSFLTHCFEDTKAVYTLIPNFFQAPDLKSYQDEMGEAITKAIKKSGVKYVVQLSSQGAHLATGVGPVNGLHAQEQRLNAIPGLNILCLRAGYFMENLLGNISFIKRQGFNGGPMRPDMPLPFIASKDISKVAAERLLKLDFVGQNVVDLLGQRHLTMIEVTEILGREIGKPDLRYVQFSYEEAVKNMVNSGMSYSVAAAMVELARTANEGKGIVEVKRTPANTTETSFEEWAKVFARVYQSI